MRNFLVLFLLFLFTVPIFSQDLVLWNEEFTATASGSDLSKQWNLSDDFRNLGDYNGLMTIVLDVDSLTDVDNTADVLYFLPYYKIAGNWYKGDTIQWDSLNTSEIDDTILDVNMEAVNVSTSLSRVLIWRSDPSSTTTIEGYPASTAFGLKMLHADSVNFKLNCRIGRY